MIPERTKAFLLPISILALLEIWARAADLKSDSLAPPSAIAAALVEAFQDGSMLTATRDTLISAFTGLSIGGAVGLAFGIALGIFHIFDRLMEVTIESIRPIPSIALLPIALIALGFGYRMEITIVAFACVWPILILTRAAVGGIEPRLIEVSRALRLSPADRVRKIIIPAALPRIFLAFRLAAGIALIAARPGELAETRAVAIDLDLRRAGSIPGITVQGIGDAQVQRQPARGRRVRDEIPHQRRAVV